MSIQHCRTVHDSRSLDHDDDDDARIGRSASGGLVMRVFRRTGSRESASKAKAVDLASRLETEGSMALQKLKRGKGAMMSNDMKGSKGSKFMAPPSLSCGVRITTMEAMRKFSNQQGKKKQLEEKNAAAPLTPGEIWARQRNYDKERRRAALEVRARNKGPNDMSMTNIDPAESAIVASSSNGASTTVGEEGPLSRSADASTRRATHAGGMSGSRRLLADGPAHSKGSDGPARTRSPPHHHDATDDVNKSSKGPGPASPSSASFNAKKMAHQKAEATRLQNAKILAAKELAVLADDGDYNSASATRKGSCSTVGTAEETVSPSSSMSNCSTPPRRGAGGVRQKSSSNTTGAQLSGGAKYCPRSVASSLWGQDIVDGTSPMRPSSLPDSSLVADSEAINVAGSGGGISSAQHRQEELEAPAMAQLHPDVPVETSVSVQSATPTNHQPAPLQDKSKSATDLAVDRGASPIPHRQKKLEEVMDLLLSDQTETTQVPASPPRTPQQKQEQEQEEQPLIHFADEDAGGRCGNGTTTTAFRKKTSLAAPSHSREACTTAAQHRQPFSLFPCHASNGENEDSRHSPYVPLAKPHTSDATPLPTHVSTARLRKRALEQARLKSLKESTASAFSVCTNPFTSSRLQPVDRGIIDPGMKPSMDKFGGSRQCAGFSTRTNHEKEQQLAKLKASALIKGAEMTLGTEKNELQEAVEVTLKPAPKVLWTDEHSPLVITFDVSALSKNGKGMEERKSTDARVVPSMLNNASRGEKAAIDAHQKDLVSSSAKTPRARGGQQPQQQEHVLGVGIVKCKTHMMSTRHHNHQPSGNHQNPSNRNYHQHPSNRNHYPTRGDGRRIMLMAQPTLDHLSLYSHPGPTNICGSMEGGKASPGARREDDQHKSVTPMMIVPICHSQDLVLVNRLHGHDDGGPSAAPVAALSPRESSRQCARVRAEIGSMGAAGNQCPERLAGFPPSVDIKSNRRKECQKVS